MFPETNCGQRCRKSWCGVIALYDWGLRFVVLRSPQWILSTAWPSECISESWGKMVIHIFYHFLIWLLYLLYFIMIYSVFTIIAYTFRQFRFLRHIFRGIFCIAEVFAVFWPCAVCYGILIPCFLFYLYTWQHIVLRHLVLGFLGHLRDVKETIKSLVYHQILVYHGLFVYHPGFLIEITTLENPPFLDKPHDCLFPLIRKRMKIQRFIPLEHESWSW